ncbi:ubiquitin-like protein [Agrocybe pediades]|nr:ubiquitin-like protein [Agrocybe pediades]
MSDEERQQPTQEPEPKLEESNNTINIKVVSAAGEEVFFKIKRSTKLSKLQGAYANKVGKDVGSIRFLYDGERIGDDDTPASLDMDDNDTIDVMVERTAISPMLINLFTRFSYASFSFFSEVGGSYSH